MSKYLIKVYLSNGHVWEIGYDTLEGMNNYCKDLFSDDNLSVDLNGGVVRYTVEEVSI